MKKTMYFPQLTAIFSACLLSACGGGNGNGNTHSSLNFSNQTPELACSSLSSVKISAAEIALQTQGAEIQSAKYLPASDNNVVAHCLVTGKIVSIDPAAQPIQFRVALPDSWNRKMTHLGGGGFNGVIPAVSNTALSFLGTAPLVKNFVVFGGDSGHSSGDPGDGSFLLNQEQLQNYAGDSLKKTRDAVVYLVRARYAENPVRTYFVGGSGGGREGFDVIQRFSADYDGVVSFFPAYAYTSLFLKFNDIGRAQHLDSGKGFFDKNKAQLLYDAQVNACDALDGVQDKLISNVRACTYNPNILRCPSGADEGPKCFSDAQLNTVDVISTPSIYPYNLANGSNSFGPYLPGTNFNSSVFSFGELEYSQPPTAAQLGVGYRLGDGLIRFGVLKDSNADVLNFDSFNPGKYQSRLIELSEILDKSSVTAVKSYMSKGGKFILLHGESDTLIPAQTSIDYYKRLVSEYGKEAIDNYMRFYLIPGYGHGDGAFVTSIEGLDLLENWVEQNKPPSGVTVRDLSSLNQARTRPACDYPAWPRYKGAGDVNSANSFTCVIN